MHEFVVVTRGQGLLFHEHFDMSMLMSTCTNIGFIGF